MSKIRTFWNPQLSEIGTSIDRFIWKKFYDPEMSKRSSLVIWTGLVPISDIKYCLKSELCSVPYSALFRIQTLTVVAFLFSMFCEENAFVSKTMKNWIQITKLVQWKSKIQAFKNRNCSKSGHNFSYRLLE